MNKEALENVIREMLKSVNQAEGSAPATSAASVASGNGTDIKVSDYPLGAKRPELIKTAGGKNLSDITLEGVLDGTIGPDDVRITAETLKMQASVARNAGRTTLANNFERAAELVAVPDARVLEIYNALRPYRSTKAELEGIADELANQYNAKITSAFVRETASLYEARKKLKGDN